VSVGSSFLRALAAIAIATTAIGCGSGDDTTSTGEPDAGPANHTVVLHPDAPPLPGESACTVTITTGIPVAKAQHVPVCTRVEYATNPPSGGDHWPYWADFRAYDTPVPREMYVHDQEHGAVVLAYRCDGPCPDVVSALEKVFDGVAPDPLCAGGASSARKILTPDPELAAPIAAAAWGATYVATCIDPESLASFVADHYGHGPEQICGAGIDPATGPTCDDAGP
jgi:hypothetical protein